MLNMRLQKHWVDNINYSLDIGKYESCLGKTISINPEFKRDIVEVDADNAIVKLSIKISKENDSPFDINVTLCGLFECKDWKDTSDGQDFMKFTSVQVLFPYLRQIVSTLTGLSNIQQYVLPIINIFDFFK